MSALPALTDANRLAAVRELAILDTPPEPAYDDLAAIAAAIFGDAAGAVDFVDGDRHFTKAVFGVPAGAGASVPVQLSFCARAVDSRDGVLIVPDTLADPVWADRPLVTGESRIRFYAGVAIASQGERVGAICAFGDQPHEVSSGKLTALRALGRLVEAQLDLRLRTAQLSVLELTDPLTGVGNRRQLIDSLTRALDERPQTGAQVGVLFCTVDHFKFVNDDYGHEAGDRLLCELAGRLSELIRDTDVIARMAGAEFMVVCPRVEDTETLMDIVDRVEAVRLSAPAPGAAQPRVSVGAALARSGEAAPELLRRIEQEMQSHRHLRHRTALRLVG